MPKEIQNQTKQKNTVATVGMWFSIIWFVALITVFFARLWFPLLFIWFILWVIGLFYKPKWKARIAVCIPLVVFIAVVSITCYIWNSVKKPAYEFLDRAKPQLEQLDNGEIFDDDRFENILQFEINSMINNKSEDERKAKFETSTWSNALEKGSYLFFSILKQGFENALEKYNNWEMVEVDDADFNIVDIDIDIDDEDTQDKETDKEGTKAEEPKKENVEVFTQSEKNDIEQILNILE